MTYLSTKTLREAVLRLGSSRASKGFVDFLIVKRGIKLSDSDKVATGTRSEELQQATTELMAVDPADEDDVERPNPFINVFGTRSHGDNGYRSSKYRSNGTSVTVPRWMDVFDVVSRGPAVVRFKDDYLEHVEDRVLTSINDPRPHILDAAQWLFRFADLGEGGFELSEDLDGQLVDRFIDEMGLSQEEIQRLFEDATNAPEDVYEDLTYEEVMVEIDSHPETSESSTEDVSASASTQT